jgi:hypothetical protein
MKLYLFRTFPLSIIRNFSLYTQQWYMSYMFRKLSANLYDIYHCCVYSKKTPDDGQRNCPKHVEFHSKNKFEKLVHLVGFLYKLIIIHGHMNVKRTFESKTLFINSAWLGQFHYPSSGVFYYKHSNGIRHTGFLTVCETCMAYTIAVCTVINSWWWKEEMSKTCRVSFQEKIW